MIGVFCGIALGVAVTLIICGIIMVWTDRGRTGNVRIGNLHVKGGALVCIVTGALLLVFGINVWTKAGTDTRTISDTSDVLRFIVPTAHAANEIGEQTGGWVYIGPENDYSSWVVSPAKSESLAYGSVLHATGSALVRADHVSEWSGTILDGFINKPAVVAKLAKGDCVRILDREKLGVRSLWARVEKTECLAKKEGA